MSRRPSTAPQAPRFYGRAAPCSSATGFGMSTARNPSACRPYLAVSAHVPQAHSLVARRAGQVRAVWRELDAVDGVRVTGEEHRGCVQRRRARHAARGKAGQRPAASLLRHCQHVLLSPRPLGTCCERKIVRILLGTAFALHARHAQSYGADRGTLDTRSASGARRCCAGGRASCGGGRRPAWHLPSYRWYRLPPVRRLLLGTQPNFSPSASFTRTRW